MELHSPKAARGIADAIIAAIERVAELPYSGKPFSDEDLARTYRCILVRNYWVFYSFDDRTLTVWRIFHASQDYDTYGFELWND